MQCLFVNPPLSQSEIELSESFKDYIKDGNEFPFHAYDRCSHSASSAARQGDAVHNINTSKYDVVVLNFQKVLREAAASASSFCPRASLFRSQATSLHVNCDGM